MRVAIGSENPVKIQAVKLAFEKVFPKKQWTFIGISVSSGVSDQPMSSRESIGGARKRAKEALQKTKADFGVGMEGGLQEIQRSWFNSGWAVVIDENKTEGIGSSIGMLVPEKIMDHVQNGIELGIACDIVFQKTNSKHKSGFFGLMTNDHITRAHGYKDAVITALSRFLHPELF